METITLRNVTMQFRRATQESGSLKEWLVQTLQGRKR